MSDFVVKALINNVEKSADVVANLDPIATFDNVDYFYRLEISGLTQGTTYYLDDERKAYVEYATGPGAWQCAYGKGQYYNELSFSIKSESQGVVELDKSNICNLENAYIAVENGNLVLYYNTIYKNTSPVSHAELDEVKASVANKQDKLTAGQGIEINNNVISKVGTKVATVSFTVTTSDVQGWKVVNNATPINESGKTFNRSIPTLIKSGSSDNVSTIPCVLYAGINKVGGDLFMIYIDTVPQEEKTFTFSILQ